MYKRKLITFLLVPACWYIAMDICVCAFYLFLHHLLYFRLLFFVFFIPLLIQFTVCISLFYHHDHHIAFVVHKLFLFFVIHSHFFSLHNGTSEFLPIFIHKRNWNRAPSSSLQCVVWKTFFLCFCCCRSIHTFLSF